MSFCFGLGWERLRTEGTRGRKEQGGERERDDSTIKESSLFSRIKSLYRIASHRIAGIVPTHVSQIPNQPLPIEVFGYPSDCTEPVRSCNIPAAAKRKEERLQTRIYLAREYRPCSSIQSSLSTGRSLAMRDKEYQDHSLEHTRLDNWTWPVKKRRDMAIPTEMQTPKNPQHHYMCSLREIGKVDK